MREFAGNFMKLFSGNLGAQLIVVACAPVITRLYDPGELGIAAVFVALAALIAPVTTLRYEGGIVLPEEDRPAHNLLAVVCLSSLVVAALVSVVLGLYPGLLDLVGRSAVKRYAWLLPAAVLLDGWMQGFGSWNLRRKYYRNLAGSRAVSAAVEQGARVGAGGLGWAGVPALIYTGLVGRLIALVWMMFRWVRRDARAFRAALDPATAWAAMARYKRFPQFSVWTGLCNSLSRQFPFLLLAAYFNDSVVGMYALGAAVLGRPVMVVGSSLSQAFYQEAAVLVRENRPLRPLVSRLMRTGLALYTMPFVLLAFFGGPLFGFLFGAEWFTAGQYAQVLAPLFLLVLLYRQGATLMMALERQDVALVFQVVLLVARLAGLVLGGRSGSALVALAAYSGASCLVFAWGTLWIARHASIRGRELVRWSLSYGSLSLVCALAGWLVFRYLPGGLVSLVLCSGASAAVYYLLLLRFDRSLQEPIRFLLDLFRKKTGMSSSEMDA